MSSQIKTSSDRPVNSEAMRITSGPVFPEEDLLDMNLQIHCMEREAYGAVLRAFSVQSESLTWVHVRNDQWGNNPSSFSPKTNVGQAIIPVHQNRQVVSTGKVREPPAVQASNRGFVHSDHDNFKSDIIEIRPTDKLIQEVEKACGGENPDPVQLERAKRLLREHERALMEAIGKLADVTDCDESPDQRWCQHSGEEPHRNAYGVPDSARRKLDRTRGYYTEGYVKDHSGIGIPFIDLPDDEYDQHC